MVRSAALALVLVLLATVVGDCAPSAGFGPVSPLQPTSPGCFWITPGFSVGFGSGNPYSPAIAAGSNSPILVSHLGYHGNANGGLMAGSMMTKMRYMSECYSPNILVALDQACTATGGAAATTCTSTPATTTACTSTVACVEPAAVIFNVTTGTPSATIQLDSDALGGDNCHDCDWVAWTEDPYLGSTNPGFGAITYGAVTVGTLAQSNWACFNASGGASGGTNTSECQPVIFGGNVNSSADAFSFLCRASCGVAASGSNKGFLPVSGISEGGVAQIPPPGGSGTGIGATIAISGQMQKSNGATFTGQQNLLIGHITQLGRIDGVNWETQCGLQTSLTALNSMCNGAYVLTDKVYYDAWFGFAITAITNTGGQTFNFNPPGAAACGSNLVVTTTGTTIAQAAANAVATYNADATHTCPNTRYQLVAGTNASWAAVGCGASTGCIAVVDRNGDPNLDSTTPGTATCTVGTATSITCGSSAFMGNSNLNTGFSFGVIRAAPNLCTNCAIIKQSAEVDTNLPNGTASNSQDEFYALFLVQFNPTGSGTGIKYCTIDGYNCVTKDITGNAGAAQSILRLMGAGGVGTVASQTQCTGSCASGTADVSENMPLGWCSNSVTPIGTALGGTNCQVGTTGGPNTANPFIMRVPTNTSGTCIHTVGTPPFQYSLTGAAQVAGTATSGTDIGFDGVGLGSASVHLTMFGSTTTTGTGIQQFCDFRISTANRQVTEAMVASTTQTTISNGGYASVANLTGASGQMAVYMAVPNGGQVTFQSSSSVTGGCTGSFTGICGMFATSTNYTSFGALTNSFQNITGHANSLGTQSVITDIEDGTNVLELFSPGALANCSLATPNCDYYIVAHPVP